MVHNSLKVRLKHNCSCAGNSNKKGQAEQHGQQLPCEYGVILMRTPDLNKVRKHSVAVFPTHILYFGHFVILWL